MPRKLLDDEMRVHINEWLKEYTPEDLREGITTVRGKMCAALDFVTVDLASSVKIWQDFDNPVLYRFEYLYLEDGVPKLGHFYLDTRHWGRVK